MIPSHFVWAHATEQPPSGVFRRQTGNLAMDLSGTDATHPVALSHVVKTLAADRSRSTTIIHWIVREEDSPADPASLDCLYPTRLRNGVYDSEESAQVPLAEALPPARSVPLPAIGPGLVSEWPGVRRRAGAR